MPLHITDQKSGDVTPRAIYASDLSKHALPRHRMPDVGVQATTAAALVRDELLLDGNSRQNLATFCTTWVEPEVRQLMGECVDKNMIDKDEYPQTAAIESRCVHILADLWHSPEAATTLAVRRPGRARPPCSAALP